MVRSVARWMLVAIVVVGAGMAQAGTESGLPNFTDIVEKNGPAVVNISTTQKPKKEAPRRGVPHGRRPFPEGTPFDEFFRRFYDDNGEPREFEGSSLGSGFIISKDGYILTNNHVIDQADEIIVRLNDKRELQAKVIGTDPRSDVALLKVSADNLPVVKIGKSSRVKSGEWVLAIGSPFDFDHSVTAGIVSAVGRSLPNENYVPFIQTDVAINPGNSGGPLFNLDGEVIGINSQIYSRTGGFMGLSFAIPIELAMDAVDQLKRSGKVSRGWLGVLIQDVTRELAESFGMEKPGGALVSQIVPDGPAAKAGLKPGDVIVEYDGREVRDSASLPPMVGATAINKSVKLKVIRDGKPRVLSISVGELPPEEKLAEAGGKQSGGLTDKRLKIELADLTKDQREELGIDKNGVLVIGVGDGPAYRQGIREGDVITMVNNENVRDVAHFKTLMAGVKSGKTVALLVQRRSGPVFLALKIPADND